jgi:DNA-binding NarL/FixJ family response regulator
MRAPIVQTRVLVADDQQIVRRGLATMIQEEPDLVVVGEAADGVEAVEQARLLVPDVVLMDVRMPRLDGISATREIMTAGTARAVVIVTTFDDEEYLLDGVRAGAAGFLLKDAGPELLAAAVRAALAGDALIDPAMTRSLLEHKLRSTARIAPQDPRLSTLSEREREVLAAVALGDSNAEIARLLWVSEATVKTHISSILSKIDANNRVQAAVFAYESGFIRPGWLEG